MKILLINGPNLNMLGKRDRSIYGAKTLDEINAEMIGKGRQKGAEIIPFQSNHEGTLIDFIQAESAKADGIIINPGALTHYGLSLMDALSDSRLPVIEIHISDIAAREDFRKVSVIRPIAKAQISGRGWQGYLEALNMLVEILKGS